ncbi:hypothetical protein L873DRAFT_925415 [Choiromyces venosus 120613-1]|uniref:Uncharacterized protein n=1 Tax=Choiromyces venosus 120613-1 TaxID=1336337 RepID=A0A3N4JRD5_9PEZI|nr:hypothetical protein L873DRAFT_925415 [Choiromyces venosus 120613-1]
MSAMGHCIVAAVGILRTVIVYCGFLKASDGLQFLLYIFYIGGIPLRLTRMI